MNTRRIAPGRYLPASSSTCNPGKTTGHCSTRLDRLPLRDDAEDVAAMLIALGQGIAAEASADCGWDCTGAVRCAERLVRQLLAP